VQLLSGISKLIYANFITDDTRGKNAIFQELQSSLAGYYVLMRKEFLALGIEINTPDQNVGKNVAFEIYVEGRPIGHSYLPRYLIALENPNHNDLNGDLEYCKNFNKIFTWNSDLHELGSAIKVLSPAELLSGKFLGYEERNIFSCLINANKAFKKKISSDLYAERIIVIRWYEENAPQDFELYGRGWDKPSPEFELLGKMRRSIPSLGVKLFGYKYFPSYKGEVIDKGSILQRSKFSYCYENNKEMPNYITEKIIDSFLYGCVPVYWGANNVLDFIPEDCFIDRRKFKNTQDVHEHLISISPQEYFNYQSRISEFLKGEVAKQFSFEYFVSTVVDNISKEFTISKV
jgi:alpha(1,3/1,4) fucosyltransferase